MRSTFRLESPIIFVGIATRYLMDGPGIESRWGRSFLHPSRPALGPTKPPVQWVLCPGRGFDQLPPFSAEVKGKVELFLYSPSETSWPVVLRTLKCICLLFPLSNCDLPESLQRCHTTDTLLPPKHFIIHLKTNSVILKMGAVGSSETLGQNDLLMCENPEGHHLNYDNILILFIVELNMTAAYSWWHAIMKLKDIMYVCIYYVCVA